MAPTSSGCNVLLSYPPLQDSWYLEAPMSSGQPRYCIRPPEAPITAAVRSVLDKPKLEISRRTVYLYTPPCAVPSPHALDKWVRPHLWRFAQRAPYRTGHSEALIGQSKTQLQTTDQVPVVRASFNETQPVEERSSNARNGPMDYGDFQQGLEAPE